MASSASPSHTTLHVTRGDRLAADGVRIAVVGATGLVGREMLKVLHARQFPAREVVPMASDRSLGTEVEYGEHSLKVVEATAESLQGFDLVLMSAGSEVSEKLAPKAAAAGALVIDNSAFWRMHPDVPLVVPEVNGEDVALAAERRIIANPNCSTIQMVAALAPLHVKAKLKRVVVCTYQAVSGAGQRGVEELSGQVTALYAQQELNRSVFHKRIAFNVVPEIDVFLPDGSTKEERKMREETQKILHAPGLGVMATCVRVPVFNGHSLSATCEFFQPLSADEARALLREAKGVVLLDEPENHGYPTPVEVDGEDATFVGRVRSDVSVTSGLSLWVVADNLRKGAATNAVQIAEIWLAGR